MRKEKHAACYVAKNHSSTHIYQPGKFGSNCLGKKYGGDFTVSKFTTENPWHYLHKGQYDFMMSSSVFTLAVTAN